MNCVIQGVKAGLGDVTRLRSRQTSVWRCRMLSRDVLLMAGPTVLKPDLTKRDTVYSENCIIIAQI